MIAAEAVATSGAPGPLEPPDDRSAWIAQVYAAHASELAAYVERSFGGQVAPEDVVQDAFARLVRETAAGRRPTWARAWLYRVVRNLAVDELRRPIRFEPETAGERAPTAWTPSAEEEFEAWSLSPELRRAVGSLTQAARTGILMAAEGYTGREIAAVTGRSELATRALLCRTRRVMRGVLAGGACSVRLGTEPRLAA